MALINFINLTGEVLTAKHLYIVDDNKELLQVGYEKVREWWKNILVESVTVLDQTKENDEQIMKPHIFLNFFRSNHTGDQPKAIYFKDLNGNMIEFTNEIHKCWAEDYVLNENLRIIGANDIIHYYVTSLVNQVIIIEMVDGIGTNHYKNKTIYKTDTLPEVLELWDDNSYTERNLNTILSFIENIPDVGLALSDTVTIERK